MEHKDDLQDFYKNRMMANKNSREETQVIAVKNENEHCENSKLLAVLGNFGVLGVK